MNDINVNLLIGYYNNKNIQLIDKISTKKFKVTELPIITLVSSRGNCSDCEESEFALHFYIVKEASKLALFLGTQTIIKCNNNDDDNDGASNVISTLDVEIPFIEDGDYVVQAYYDDDIKVKGIYTYDEMKEKAKVLFDNEDCLIATNEIRIIFEDEEDA